MKGTALNIEQETLQNTFFRRVIYTAKHCQLVLMNLLPNEEIGMEVHEDGDQFFRFEEGIGQCIIDDNAYNVTNGSIVIVPAGAKHNIINTSKSKNLKFYTIYAPPHHKDGIIRITKKEAEAFEAVFDGVISEQ